MVSSPDKKVRLFSALYAFLIGALVAYGSLMGFVTAFSLRTSVFLLPLLLLFDGLFVWLFYTGKEKIARLTLFSLPVVCLFFGLLKQFSNLLYQVSARIDEDYGFGVLDFRGDSAGLSSSFEPSFHFGTDLQRVTLPLLVLGCFLVFANLSVIWKGKRAVPISAANLVPLILAGTLLEAFPRISQIFCLFLAVLLMLLNSHARGQQEETGNRQVRRLFLPTVAFLLALFLIFPRAGYTPADINVYDVLPAWMTGSRTENSGGETVAVEGPTGESVSLESVGPKETQRLPILKLTLEGNRLPSNTPFYLRGRAYDLYDGKTWAGSVGYWPNDGDFWSGDYLGQGRIVTNVPHKIRYFPYSPGEELSLHRGRVENTAMKKEYTFSVFASAENQVNFENVFVGEIPESMAVYLEMNAAAKEELQGILNQNGIRPINSGSFGLEYVRLAEAIGNLVRSSAEYSLREADRMPSEAEDFAVWFLKEGEKGYCVHFATSCAALLRAAGIPARYVSGYLTEGGVGSRTVYLSDAHAWVEYWVPTVGWLILDPTPAAERNENHLPEEPSEEESSLPEEEESSVWEEESSLPEEESSRTPEEEPDNPEKEPLSIPAWVGLPMVILAFGLILFGLGRLVASIRLARYAAAKSNRKAELRYQGIWILCRLLKKEVPEAATFLANKARFSRHIISETELSQLQTIFDALRKEIGKQPLLWIFCYQILGLW